MSEDFNLFSAHRPPREDGYAEETTFIVERLQNRGDQRIGQYLINAVRHTEKYKTLTKTDRFNNKEAVESILWGMEAPELLEAIEKMEERHT